MHNLIECSPLIGGALNFLAAALRVAVYVKTRRRPPSDNARTEPRPDQ
jgi:hypothetical protein